LKPKKEGSVSISKAKFKKESENLGDVFKKDDKSKQ